MISAHDIDTECGRQLLTDADRLKIAALLIDEAAKICSLAGEPRMRGFCTALRMTITRRAVELDSEMARGKEAE